MVTTWYCTRIQSQTRHRKEFIYAKKEHSIIIDNDMTLLLFFNTRFCNVNFLRFNIIYFFYFYISRRQLENLVYYNRLKNSKIVISDFHLAKLENGLIKEPCGTPEYLGKEKVSEFSGVTAPMTYGY